MHNGGVIAWLATNVYEWHGPSWRMEKRMRLRLEFDEHLFEYLCSTVWEIYNVFNW